MVTFQRWMLLFLFVFHAKQGRLLEDYVVLSASMSVLVGTTRALRGASAGRQPQDPPFRKSQPYFLMVCPIDRFSGRPSAFSSSLLEWLGRVFREGLHPRGRTVFQSRGPSQYLPLASITCFSVGSCFSTSTTCQGSVPC